MQIANSLLMSSEQRNVTSREEEEGGQDAEPQFALCTMVCSFPAHSLLGLTPGPTAALQVISIYTLVQTFGPVRHGAVNRAAIPIGAPPSGNLDIGP